MWMNIFNSALKKKKVYIKYYLNTINNWTLFNLVNQIENIIRDFTFSFRIGIFNENLINNLGFFYQFF